MTTDHPFDGLCDYLAVSTSQALDQTGMMIALVVLGLILAEFTWEIGSRLRKNWIEAQRQIEESEKFYARLEAGEREEDKF